MRDYWPRIAWDREGRVWRPAAGVDARPTGCYPGKHRNAAQTNFENRSGADGWRCACQAAIERAAEGQDYQFRDAVDFEGIVRREAGDGRARGFAVRRADRRIRAVVRDRKST